MSTIIFDIETSPMAEEIYKRLPSIGQWPGRTMKTQNHSIICFGFKELNSNKTYCLNGWDYNEDWATNDEPLVNEIFQILQSATEIVTYNGIKFDLKAINTRLIKYGYPALPKTKHVDLCNIAKHKLSMYSNKLDDVADYLGIGNKISWDNKWKLWTDIAFNRASKKELKLMSNYCKQDVDLTEALYLKMRSHVGNTGLNKNIVSDSDKPVCHTCGSTNLKKWSTVPTASGVYQRLLCLDCNTWNKLYKTGKKTGAL